MSSEEVGRFRLNGKVRCLVEEAEASADTGCADIQGKRPVAVWLSEMFSGVPGAGLIRPLGRNMGRCPVAESGDWLRKEVARGEAKIEAAECNAGDAEDTEGEDKDENATPHVDEDTEGARGKGEDPDSASKDIEAASGD